MQTWFEIWYDVQQVQGRQIWERNESHCKWQSQSQHSVMRHGLKNEPTHAGPGRQPGSEREPGKNTCCPATLSFSLSGDHLHSSYRHKISSTKQNKQKYPLEFKLSYIHNHSINSADALKYRPVSEECKMKFNELFRNDQSLSSAFAQYKRELLSGKNDIEMMTIMADRSLVPDYFWVFYFHKKYIESTYGSASGPDVYKRAKERIDTYNEKNGAELAKMEESEKGEIIIVICDKFCRRVHEKVPETGDIVLVDATSNLD